VTLIDSHTHLYLPEFDNDREQVVKRAIESGVKYLLLPNIDTDSYPKMIKMSEAYPDTCLPMIGLHPTSAKDNYRQELDAISKKINEHNFIAIGEIGIDLYWDKSYFKQQEAAFREQIQWAKDRHLPIVIHARDSFDEIFKVMEEEIDGNLTGVFHSFTGTAEQAQRIINWGFKIGIGGIVSFKNAGLDKVVKEIDLDHIILETDSPYLAPVPRRRKRNESAYIVHIAQKIAAIHETSIDKVAKKTTENAKALFKLD